MTAIHLTAGQSPPRATDRLGDPSRHAGAPGVEAHLDRGRVMLRRITADEFFKIIRAGIIDESEKVELIDGVIEQLAPAGDDHHDALLFLTEALRPLDGFRLCVQLTLKLPNDTVVDPDVLLVRKTARPKGSFGPDQVLLAIEVGKSSLARDRSLKAALYAAAGIPEYWIVDVEDQSIHVHADPSRDVYKKTSVVSNAETVTATRIPSVTIPVSDIFPPLNTAP